MPPSRFLSFTGLLLFALSGFFTAPLRGQSSLGTASAWEPDKGSPQVRSQDGDLVFVCEFSGSRERHYWDRRVDLDWTEMDGLRITYRLVNAEAFKAVTFYVQSGSEWRSVSLPGGEGWQTVWLPFSDFTDGERQNFWGRIDTLRLSPWKSGEGKGVLELKELSAVRSQILSVDPDEASSVNPAELAYGQEISKSLSRQFGALGFPVLRLPDARAARTDLSKFDAVILPYNAYPSEELLQALDQYLAGGGRLLVFYSASPELAVMCGFSLQRFLQENHERRWHTLRFSGEDWMGPEALQMPSRNIYPLLPLGNSRRLAQWQSSDGKTQKEAGALISDRAVWFTSVFRPIEEGAQRKVLASVSDLLWPELEVSLMAAFRKREQLLEHPQYAKAGTALLQEMEEVETRLARQEGFAAWALLDEIERKLNQLQGEAFRMPAFEMRGVWDHSGQGLDNGKWSRTIDLLVEAGFTDLFVYVPRSSGNPIKVLRESGERIAVHAWHICWVVNELSPATRRRYEREGRLQITENGEVMPWLCPAHPDNISSEIRRILELASTRGLQGVHLDYVRWQEGKPCACENCEKAFTASVGRAVRWPTVLREGPLHPLYLKWRAEVIDDFVEQVSLRMRKEYPDLKFSAAVWPSVGKTGARIGQNWAPWVRKGWFDFVVPMNYSEEIGAFEAFLDAQREQAGRRAKIMSGIGVRSSMSRLSPPEVLEQITAAAAKGANGFVLFQLDAAFARELLPVLIESATKP